MLPTRTAPMRTAIGRRRAATIRIRRRTIAPLRTAPPAARSSAPPSGRPPPRPGGGAIGRYQDQQDAALRQQMQGTGVEVVRQGHNITLDMPSAITFGFDSSALNPAFYGTLDRVASTLREYGQTIIEIAGHTDSVGTDAYNQALSVRRAQAVADYLIGRGLNRDRIIVVGAGETRPVASNDTESGRAQNRRVEVTIVPLTND